MTIYAGSEITHRVIEVDQLEIPRSLGLQPLDILQRIGAAGEDMAGIGTDTQTRIIELAHEPDELIPGPQHLRALTRRRLEEQRTLDRCSLQTRQDIRLHVRSGHSCVLMRGLPYMYHHTLAPHPRCIP